MIFGAILAGGIGSRMQTADMPKQFLNLGDRPIVIHTLEKFLANSRFECVLIGVHKDWSSHMEDLIAKYIPRPMASRVRVVVGGSDRNGTILNIIYAIETEYSEHDDHVIVTHDSVRPFVTSRMIEENINAAIQYGAVDTVVSAVDTIVMSNDGVTITEIPDRTKMYQGQTPQSFRIKILKELYASLSNEEKAILTDACKICVIRNHPVHLIEGSVTNLKITTPGDLKIAQALVEGAI